MKRSHGELRIIGGALRGRRWRIPDVPGLRPTPDRVRETLFNWLAPHITGARVIDLFAGSGALGLEACSRGAGHVTLVEQHRDALTALRDAVAKFGLQQVQVVAGEALGYLARLAADQFDIVLLDPPFDSALLAPALRMVAERKLLAAGGFCYIEHAAAVASPPLPAGWTLHRSGKAGEVGYHLLHVPPSDLSRNL